MSEMPWLESHLGSMEKAKQLIEEFHWKLEIFESDNSKWYVKSGEAVIFVGQSLQEVEVFLYGMALAYSGIPSPYFEKLVEDVDHWYKTL